MKTDDNSNDEKLFVKIRQQGVVIFLTGYFRIMSANYLIQLSLGLSDYPLVSKSMIIKITMLYLLFMGIKEIHAGIMWIYYPKWNPELRKKFLRDK